MFRSSRSEAWSRGLAGAPPAPRLEASVLLASLALNVLSLGLPIVILQVYDRILPNQSYKTLSVLILSLCVVLLLDGFFRTARSYITGWNAARYEHKTACRMVDRLLGCDLRAIESVSSGVHLDRIQSIDQVREYHAGQARLVMIDLPFVVLFLGLIWFIAGTLVIVPLALLALLGLCAWAIGRRLKGVLEERTHLDDRRHSFIIEVLTGIQTVKLLAMEALMQRRYERLTENGSTNTYRTVILSNLAQNLGGMLTNLIMASVAAYGASFVIAGELTIGGLAASTLLAGRAVQPLLRALSLWALFQNISLANERIAALFELAPETKYDAETMPEISGGFSFEGVSYAFDEGEAPLLDNVNLDVAAGEIVGITGDTGSGKTTLLLLAMGMLKPTAGRVLFDGIDISRRDRESFRQQIAYLPQSANLFQGSILDNLTLFQGRAALEPALEASRMLRIDEIITRLPQGYDTRVGDGAQDDLPAGTKQGIAMARALARRPRLILFDEANSSSDSRSDAVLKEALGQWKGKTAMVLISHRPSLLALADRTYFLENGKLVNPSERSEPARSKPGPQSAPHPESEGASSKGRVA